MEIGIKTYKFNWLEDIIAPYEKRKSLTGFTLIELIIVVTIISILITMAIPNFYRMRIMTRKTICQNNLRQIEAAVDRWVFENNIDDGIIVSESDEQIIYSYLRGGKPECPVNGTYTIGAIGTSPQVTCSYEGHTLYEEQTLVK